ncbi:MAG: hypothetical protein ACRD0S_02730 [Acidimicrobiales bacterium]
MSQRRISQLRSLEGRTVSVALADGSRLDGCQLVSGGRRGLGSLWVFANGADLFIPLPDVLDCWEVR